MSDESLSVALARHDQRILVTEQGVANFREFTKKVGEFMIRSEERADNQARFRLIRDQEIKDAIELADRKRNDAIAERERKFNHLTVVAGLLFTAMLIMLGYMTYRDSKRAAGISPSHLVSEKQLPQDATVHSH